MWIPLCPGHALTVAGGEVAATGKRSQGWEGRGSCERAGHRGTGHPGNAGGTAPPPPPAAPRRRSPPAHPWHMKSGITRWKVEPLKCRGLPDLPTPFSPGQAAAWRGSEGPVGCRGCRRGVRPGASERGRLPTGCAAACLQEGSLCAGGPPAATRRPRVPPARPPAAADARARAPVHSARKFSAVLGTTSARSTISMRPTGEPSASMSKNTTCRGRRRQIARHRRLAGRRPAPDRGPAVSGPRQALSAPPQCRPRGRGRRGRGPWAAQRRPARGAPRAAAGRPKWSSKAPTPIGAARAPGCWPSWRWRRGEGAVVIWGRGGCVDGGASGGRVRGAGLERAGPAGRPLARGGGQKLLWGRAGELAGDGKRRSSRPARPSQRRLAICTTRRKRPRPRPLRPQRSARGVTAGQRGHSCRARPRSPAAAPAPAAERPGAYIPRLWPRARRPRRGDCPGRGAAAGAGAA
jgi:hypothetical protein